jgi:hypothetical protein
MPQHSSSTQAIKTSLKYASGATIIGVGTGSYFGSLMQHVPNSIAIGAGIGGGSGFFMGLCCFFSAYFCCHTAEQEDFPRVGSVVMSRVPSSHLDEKHIGTMTRL